MSCILLSSCQVDLSAHYCNNLIQEYHWFQFLMCKFSTAKPHLHIEMYDDTWFSYFINLRSKTIFGQKTGFVIFVATS